MNEELTFEYATPANPWMSATLQRRYVQRVFITSGTDGKFVSTEPVENKPAITEQPMSVYFADAQEEKPAEWGAGLTAQQMYDLLRNPYTRPPITPVVIDPNAAMIARDGPAAPKPAVVALPAAPTAHPAIAGLLVVGAVDHRLGSAFR
jgi:hypothetical protein